LIKLFVYGDPIISPKSKEAQKYWIHRKQADIYLLEVVQKYFKRLRRSNNIKITFYRVIKWGQNKSYCGHYKPTELHCLPVGWSCFSVFVGNCFDNYCTDCGSAVICL